MGFEGVPLLDPDQAERTDIRLATTAPPGVIPSSLQTASSASAPRAMTAPVAAEFCLVATHEFLCEAVIMLINAEIDRDLHRQGCMFCCNFFLSVPVCYCAGENNGHAQSPKQRRFPRLIRRAEDIETGREARQPGLAGEAPDAVDADSGDDHARSPVVTRV